MRVRGVGMELLELRVGSRCSRGVRVRVRVRSALGGGWLRDTQTSHTVAGFGSRVIWGRTGVCIIDMCLWGRCQ